MARACEASHPFVRWPSRHNVHLALPLMLSALVALHAASMFLFHTAFRVRTAARSELLPSPILPDSPEAAKLAPILAASDPALFSSANVGPNVWNLPKTAYVASFDEETPDLKPLPRRVHPSSSPESSTAPVTVATIVPKATPVPQPAPPTAGFGGGLESAPGPRRKDSSFLM